MTRAAPQQAAFAAGEISPLLWGRPDYVRHRSGLKLCRGFVPLPEGVATRAPGTQFMGRAAADGPARLMAFVFRDDDSAILEFTPNVMRVWRLGALVMDGAAPLAVATPWGADSLPLLQGVQSADRLYLVDGLTRPHRVSRLSATSWTVEPTPFRRGPFAAENVDEAVTVQASAATGAVTLAGVGGPFAGMEVGGDIRLDAVGQAEVPLWTGNTAAVVGDRFSYDGRVYEIVAFDGAGADTGVNPPTHDQGDFLSSKNGPVWRFVHRGFGVVRLTAVTGPNAAAGTVLDALPADVVAAATWRWSGPAWSAARGWPRAVGASDQRIVYGGSAAEPRAIWASRVGDFLDFSRGVEADEGFGFTLAPQRNRLNDIRWIVEGASGLHVATGGGAATARPTDQGVTLGPTTTRFAPAGGRGAARAAPEVVDGEPVYLSASRRHVHGLRYAIESDRVEADEISLNARHVLAGGAADIAWQQEPWRILWIVLDDGRLAGMTLYPQQQVYAMHVDAMAGGRVLSIAVKPTDDGGAEELWLAVERRIGGADRVFVERQAALFFDRDLVDPDWRDAWHQHAAVRWAGAAATTLTGLDHLEGETVLAWTDQGAQTGVVSGGALALQRPAATAIAGLDPSAQQVMRSLPLTPPLREGGTDGQRRRLRETGVRLLHSAGAVAVAIGIDDGRERREPPVRLERRAADPFTPVALASGVIRVAPGSGWAGDVELEIRPAPGAPLTVAGWTPSVETGDG